ncbi:hypothetical protein ACVI1J_006737 [Bradyrhizobium diazoefficiens]|uniref:hypothetical protein n=1 Tax=Bradyrhizobium diazoefficiens TaxID=1355477 RepID=UPI002729D472|nr:hypothetical protein [Bradyrhizobium diazoefficiens]WLA66047.1 hypothetical protein QNN01_04040 [Bradyrhizobium diazoefficiens]
MKVSTIRGFGAAFLLLLIIIGAAKTPTSSAPEAPRETSEQSAEKKRELEEFKHDYRIIMSIKETAVRTDIATSASFSAFNASVDLTIGSRSPARADAIADGICHRANLGLIDRRRWKVRVYLADGTLGSECRITN